jgi:hypothetical protein
MATSITFCCRARAACLCVAHKTVKLKEVNTMLAGTSTNTVGIKPVSAKRSSCHDTETKRKHITQHETEHDTIANARCSV